MGLAQWAVFTSVARFRILVAGRRFGKTFLAIIEMVHVAVSRPGSLVWYVAPTYTMARDIAWVELLTLLPRSAVIRKNEQSLTVVLTNGSRIQLRSADKPDSLRGTGIDFLVLDEAAMIKRKAWHEVLRANMADTKGRVLFITTPRGFNWFYDLYLLGLDPDHHNYQSFAFTTLEGGRVDEEELAEARATMPAPLYKQEFEASFETLQNRVYYNFNRVDHVDPSVEDVTTETLYIGQDFNVHPMASVLARKVADECHIVDSWEIPASNTAEVIREIKSRYWEPEEKKAKEAGRAPKLRHIVMCPDPTGRARSTKTSVVGQTDFTLFQQAGFTVSAPRAHPPSVDLYNNTNANLLAADGTRRVRVHPRCTTLIRALEGLTYKEGMNLPDTSTGLDHSGRALDYLLWDQFNLVQRREAKVTPFEL